MLVGRAAFAVTEADHTLADAVRGADVVIEGEVTGWRTEARDDAAFIHYAVRVDRALKGAPADTVEVSLLGGPLADGRELMVGGAPYLAVGERVLLHLAVWGDGSTYRLNSWTEGVLRDAGGAVMGAESVGVVTLPCEGEAARVPFVPEAEARGPLAAAMPWADAIAAVEACIAEVGR